MYSADAGSGPKPSSNRATGFMGGGTTAKRNTNPAPAPIPPPPIGSSSSGQYVSGGGGAPVATRSSAPGPVQSVGRQAPSGGSGGGRNNKKGNGGVPGVGKFLNSDDRYQMSLSDLMKTLQQFNVSNKDSRGDVREAFSTAMERMGQERTKALQSLEEDFAARGLLNSGLYGSAVSDYNDEYTNRTNDLATDQSDELSRLREERRNFRSLTGSKKQALRLDAIRRRADQYGLKS